MRIIIDLDHLAQFFEPKYVSELKKYNNLGYRQNHRNTHRLLELGLIEIDRIEPSKTKGAPRIYYKISNFGKDIYERFGIRRLM